MTQASEDYVDGTALSLWHWPVAALQKLLLGDYLSRRAELL